MVNYTLFSRDLLKPHEYDRAIGEYIETTLRISRYRTAAAPAGAVTITDRPFPRRLGERVMAVGAKAGLVKPFTGAAFARIQKDSAAIARSLEDYAHPFAIPTAPWRYRLCDALFLRALERRGGQMKPLFTRILQRNPIPRLFAFCDEAGSLSEDLRLLASLAFLR